MSGVKVKPSAVSDAEALFGLSGDAYSAADVRAAYKDCIRDFHPDKVKGGFDSGELMTRINQSFPLLRSWVAERDKALAAGCRIVEAGSSVATSGSVPSPQGSSSSAFDDLLNAAFDAADEVSRDDWTSRWDQDREEARRRAQASREMNAFGVRRSEAGEFLKHVVIALAEDMESRGFAYAVLAPDYSVSKVRRVYASPLSVRRRLFSRLGSGARQDPRLLLRNESVERWRDSVSGSVLEGHLDGAEVLDLEDRLRGFLDGRFSVAYCVPGELFDGRATDYFRPCAKPMRWKMLDSVLPANVEPFSLLTDEARAVAVRSAAVPQR